MTDVVTYRTEKGEELKKLAEERNVSLSQLTNDIVDYYFKYFDLREKSGMLKISNEMMSYCFSLISNSDIQKTADLASKVITRYVKTITNDFSLVNLIKILLNYYDYNHFKFSEFNETDYIKIVCTNPMPRNWNELGVRGLCKFFNDFGFAAVEDSSNEGFHAFKISKQKSH